MGHLKRRVEGTAVGPGNWPCVGKLAFFRVSRNLSRAAPLSKERPDAISGLRKAVAGDDSALRDLVDLEPFIHEVAREAIAELRTRHGHTWEDIGGELGVTRQSAWERWGGGGQ